MRVDAVGSTFYPMPVQSVRAVEPTKRENVIQSYNKIAESNNEGAARAKFDTFERTDNGIEQEQDFKAINLIKKSAIQPPEPPTTDELRQSRVEQKPELEVRDDITQLRGELSEKSGISAEYREERRSERLEQNATVKSSDEIAAKAAGKGLTPAQQKGVEAYQRFQNYASPLSLSNAQMVG